MSETKNRKIQLRCPECKRTMMAKREPEDPPKAAVMEDWCPECVNGGFSDPRYYDSDGKQIEEGK